MDWWTDKSDEVYWCEITDRSDLGADLKCPQTNERGQEYWSYSLIQHVWPGDIVFHYLTTEMAFVGASVAGTPVEDRPIVWAPHGTIGRGNLARREPRPGWWLPLFGFKRADQKMTLESLRNPTDEAWIRDWITDLKATQGVQRVASPFQRYGQQLRAAQGYLTKMPRAFVDRWPELEAMQESVADVQDELVPLAKYSAPALIRGGGNRSVDDFRPKSETDYEAIIGAHVQRRTRHHERLVRLAGEWLKGRALEVTTPHPIDLKINSSPSVLIEAEVVHPRGELAAIREAVGQLHEYRYFIGPRDALMCVLLDSQPETALTDYTEKHLGLLIAWWTDLGLSFGPLSMTRLGFLDVNLSLDSSIGL